MYNIPGIVGIAGLLNFEREFIHLQPAIYDLLEYNIPGDITGRIEPKLNSIFSIPGIRRYRRYFTYLHGFALKGYVNKIITSISDDIV